MGLKVRLGTNTALSMEQSLGPYRGGPTNVSSLSVPVTLVLRPEILHPEVIGSVAPPERQEGDQKLAAFRLPAHGPR